MGPSSFPATLFPEELQRHGGAQQEKDKERELTRAPGHSCSRSAARTTRQDCAVFNEGDGAAGRALVQVGPFIVLERGPRAVAGVELPLQRRAPRASVHGVARQTVRTARAAANRTINFVDRG